jgi:thiopeptide-type bacteriocin biosynthesis protein
MGASLVRHAGSVHRKEKDALARLLSRSDEELDPPVALVRRALTSRDAGLADLGVQWRDAATGGQLTTSLDEIAGSLTHLHVNRMLRGAQRAQELVVYDLLDRWYRNPRAR